MNDFELDGHLVDAYVAGKLDPQGEAELARQVARLLPFHWSAPNPVAAKLLRVVDHLHGERALLAWLESHPGEPRLIARLFTFVGLLDRFSDAPAVLVALRELRADVAYPEGLEGHLLPDTDEETLASLGAEIELLLADDIGEATRVATAAATMLEQIAPRAAELDPKTDELGREAQRLREAILEAAVTA